MNRPQLAKLSNFCDLAKEMRGQSEATNRKKQFDETLTTKRDERGTGSEVQTGNR